MTFRDEFPDFDPATMPAIPSGWQDVSWHNDSCPSFEVPGTGAQVFVDFADPTLREIKKGPRFFVLGEGATTTLFTGDDWSAVLAFIGTLPVR